ncbi:GntR family transcriptional regulator [Patescibacteria group bacterium]|nr:GntR family transcriptional regulator [Patescibacteria group bacterium]
MLSELLLTEIGCLNQPTRLPLHRQLYEALRRAILDGKIAAGERLPSSRDLTLDLQLSRNTVVAAINQLTVEGYHKIINENANFFISSIIAKMDVVQIFTSTF